MKGLPESVRKVLDGNKMISYKRLHERIVCDGYVGNGTSWLVIEIFDFAHGDQCERFMYQTGSLYGWAFTWSDIQTIAVVIGDALGVKESFAKYLVGMHLFLEDMVDNMGSEYFVTEKIKLNDTYSYHGFKKGEIYLFPLKHLRDISIGPVIHPHDSVAALLSNAETTLYNPEKLREAEQMAYLRNEIVVAFVCINDEDNYSQMQALGDESGTIVVFNAKLDPELEFLNQTRQPIPKNAECHRATFESEGSLDSYFVFRNCMLSYAPGSKVGKKEQDDWAENEFRVLQQRVDKWREEQERKKRQKRKKSKKKYYPKA